MTRRQALQYLASISVTPALPGQELIGEPAGRVAPLSDLVNVFEVRAMAKPSLRRTCSRQSGARTAGL